MRRVYCRCNSGHYFVGEHCPIDGWSSPASKELIQVTKQVAASGQEPSLQELREAGLSEAAMQRAIVIEFGTMHVHSTPWRQKDTLFMECGNR